MLTLGIAGLANVGNFLARHFPEQMKRGSGIVPGTGAAAALLLDGDVLAAASEDRFGHATDSRGFPFQAIQYCLEAAAATLDEVQDVSCNFDFGRYSSSFAEDVAQAYWQECLSPDAIFGTLKSRFRPGDATRFHPIDHHDAHLHAALVSADFDRSLAVVMDAAGENGATSVYQCDGGNIVRVARHPITHSLGVFYALVTRLLGFAGNSAEANVMGLASTGDPQRYAEFFRSAVRLGPDGTVEMPCLTLTRGFAEGLFFSASSAALEQGLGLESSGCTQQERADISAALQQRFTEALLHVCRHFQQQSKATNLVLGGCCAENSASVGALRSSGMFEQIHVGYASGDDGTALGAAAACVFARGAPLRLPAFMPFFGPAPHLSGVRGVVAQHPELTLREYADERRMLDDAACDIAADKIIALCHGRMELGGTALGNRSLLALPSKAANRDRIKLAIKQRYNDLRCAPAVAAEDAPRYFMLNAGEEYPYMTMAAQVREDARPGLAAVDTHLDGTARVQTVNPRYNAPFYYLLSRLKALTGVPVVLNANYSLGDQPMACTEAEAVDTFLAMGIDALYIANTKVTRRG